MWRTITRLGRTCRWKRIRPRVGRCNSRILGQWLRCGKSADCIIGTNGGQRKPTGRELVRAVRPEAQRPVLAGGLQVRLDSRKARHRQRADQWRRHYDQGTLADETPKLSYTEFPRWTLFCTGFQ